MSPSVRFMPLIAKSPASGLCRDAGSETDREAGNLEPRDGEPGWSTFSEGVAWGAGGVGAAGFQDSSFAESGHWII